MYDAIIIEPTLRCNLFCPLCDRNIELRNKFHENLNFNQIIEKLPFQPKHIYISGGEPTIYPGLIEFCKIIAKKNISLSIHTNGTNPDIIQKLIKVGVNRFHISIDGQKNEHELIRGKGTYKKLLQTIREISFSTNCEYTTTTVVSDYNVLALEKLFSFLDKNVRRPSVMIFELARLFDKASIEDSAILLNLKVEDVSVQILDSRIFKTPLLLFRNSILRLQQQAESYRIKIKFYPDNFVTQDELLLSYTKRQKRKVKCSHRRILRIDPEGNIIPCFTFRNNLGNVLLESWTSIAGKSKLFWEKLHSCNLAPVCETCFRCVDF